MEKYKRIRKIGKGNFGDVWLVEDSKGKVLLNT
jgi:NIMA (never in mitosis gene a)-related kinase